MSRPPRLVIGVSGGSASGKTEIARAVARGAAPLSALVMAEDDYYGDHGGAPDFDAARFNFDHPDARDHGLLAEQLSALRAGRTIAAPVYDFTTHRRRAETRPIAPADIVLVEGIHLFCTEDLRAVFDLRVYVEAPDDVRLARRVLRDVAERGRDATAVVGQYLSTVRPMHREWTAPGREHADLVIRNDAAAARPAGHLEAFFDTLAGPVLDAVRRAERGVRRAG
ncbi:uridine kinase [Marinicauda salina]|uniref:uridine/cytidine kinase n=1 Tax=Marinicauda salina TaxID=2135793 RepID=A0A2U2BW28_9PROT|nr:uridine kinase [Marinicauda salina]PWE18200.1 uridine kinase [Marinicauda salina]